MRFLFAFLFSLSLHASSICPSTNDLRGLQESVVSQGWTYFKTNTRKDNKPVIILTRKAEIVKTNTELQKKNKFPEVLAMTTIDAPPEKVYETFFDRDNEFSEFMPYVVETRTYDKEKRYTLIDPPLVGRREYYSKYTSDTIPGGIRLKWEGIAGPGIDPGAVSIMPERNFGYMHFCSLASDPGKTVVVLMAHVDPNLGRWASVLGLFGLLDKASSDGLPKMFDAAENRSKDPTWTAHSQGGGVRRVVPSGTPVRTSR